MEYKKFIFAENQVSLFYRSYGANALIGDYNPHRYVKVQDGLCVGRTSNFDTNWQKLDMAVRKNPCKIVRKKCIYILYDGCIIRRDQSLFMTMGTIIFRYPLVVNSIETFNIL